VGGGSGREEVLDTFLPALIEIAEHYEKGDEFEGTRALGIHGDERSGLVLSGRPDLNPTWMDARTPNGPVTPRHGCPVEIGALWYFLLAYLEDLLGSARDTARAKRFGAMRKRAKRGFLDSFGSSAMRTSPTSGARTRSIARSGRTWCSPPHSSGVRCRGASAATWCGWPSANS
jgi:glycogen debranching enzyme